MKKEIKKDILDFQVRRNVTALFKSFLDILEEIKIENATSLKTLSSLLREEDRKLVTQASWFTEEKKQLLRKRVLDAGNTCIRNINGES